ncbi:2,3-di-O-geranylgeranylglyceryl phosphate reductase [Haloferax mucosum ATCC BAA-1512]|uniref:2,3-di-O-geranylgeranylglyceryl phosphate reductase n=1 Tax=Haloferax mucosum ATCC BAA-1512 TaxID=662479 RepID=M0IMQ1_9EURY|nr:geranylgeranyl reductase family protein [Haloferax mucosum]ELZ98071.1 2,3-di-O-geranylgeranylglyceryl phosphate reductase [Haloferax mucosum ATCC BAA-1512]
MNTSTKSSTATERAELVVVGGGTAGAFAAATAADAGLDVVLLERKSKAEAGQIACGDAIKGKTSFPNVIDLEYLKEESFTNQNIQRALFRNPLEAQELEVTFDSNGTVLDRKRFGEVLLEEAERAGATIEYNTVVSDVLQEGSQITGVRGKQADEPITYTADVTIDAAGTLSILQDKADFTGTTFDTNVQYSQFCSAYREVIEVPEPVEWDDAIVFKPTEELGYLWYFPRSPTEINVGLGFQMTEPPMNLVDVLNRELRSQSIFDGAVVKNKLGAALPTRRPYDSAVAPGYIAVGDAAGHVNPSTGGGITGAASAGYWAAEQAIDAISDGDVGEDAFWEYNHRVMTDFGKRFAAIDLYNIWATGYDVETLAELVASFPGQQLADAISGSGTPSMGLWLKLKTLISTVGHWAELRELYRVRKLAHELSAQYETYPTDRSAFEEWQTERDSIMDDFYSVCEAESKY